MVLLYPSTMDSPALLFLLLAVFPALCFSENPHMIGNPVIPAKGGTNSEGTVFILNGAVKEDGILFAFSAYFRNTNPAQFQIWRPEGTNTFKLIKEWTFTPSGSDTREDIYLHLSGTECTKVIKGDLLGIFTPEAPSPVTFTFSPALGTSYQLSFQDRNDWPQEGDVKTFDTLTYPYLFSAAAFVDTDPSSNAGNGPYPCSKTLLVPAQMVTTQAPPTPAPGPPGEKGNSGATGATGPRGASGPKGEHGATGATGTQGHTGPDGSHGATGYTGPMGEMGATGATGEMGPAGKDGEKGEKGEKGDEGPAGPPGPKSEASTDDCSWCGTLLNPYLILAVLIWLALVTLILVITVIVVSCRRNKVPYSSRKGMTTSQNDLWKKYEAAGAYENDGYETPKANGDPTYSTVEEGRTAF